MTRPDRAPSACKIVLLELTGAKKMTLWVERSGRNMIDSGSVLHKLRVNKNIGKATPPTHKIRVACNFGGEISMTRL